MSIRCRADVDGLSAVAMSAVIADQAFERYCPGGYPNQLNDTVRHS